MSWISRSSPDPKMGSKVWVTFSVSAMGVTAIWNLSPAEGSLEPLSNFHR